MRIKKELVPQKLSDIANLEAEQSIIGILIIDGGGEATEEIFTNLQVKDFYWEKHQKLFQVMKALFEKGVKIDFASTLEVIQRQFGDKVENETLGNLIYFSNLIPSSANFSYYLKIVKDYSNLRQLENVCLVGQDLTRSGKTAEYVSSYLQEQVLKITEGEIVDDCEQVTEIAEKTFEKIRKRANGEYDEFGIETGFKCLDRCLWGLQKSDLIIIAARAGVGKTAFALNVIKHAAIENKKKVAFFSLEMPKNQILERLFSLGLNLPNYNLKTGNLKEKSKDLEILKDKLKSSGLYLDDDSTNTVPKMLLKAKKMKRKVGLDLVVVDYLQFIKPQEKSGNRFQDVGEIARSLKSMARELNVPVLVLCQLNRQLDNEDREPTLADLRESGEIENNADIVMFLRLKSGRAEEIKDIDLIIGKHRNGQLKSIRMTYKGDCFKFEEKEKLPISKPEQIKAELTEIKDDSLPF